MEVIEQLEGQAQNDGDDGGKHHALDGEGTEGELGAAQTDDHDDRGHDEIGRFAVVHLAFHEHAQAGGGDHAEQQQAYAAHDGYGNAADEFGELAHEGKQNGHDGRTAEDPHAVDAGNGHDADVFAVCGVGSGAEEAGKDVGASVGKERAGKARILDEIPAHHVAGDEQMPDMFGQHHESCGSDDDDGVEVEGGGVEMRHLEPGSFDDRSKIHHAHEEGEHIAADDAEQDGDDGQKSSEGHGTDDGDDKREHGHQHVVHVDVFSREAGHGCGGGSKFKTDDGDDGPHGRGREDDVYPLGPHGLDEQGKENEQKAEHDEARLSRGVAA